MFNLNTFKQKSPKQRFLFIYGLIIFVLYLAIGAALILWKDMPAGMLARKYRIMLGVLLLVYATFRFYRVIKQEDNYTE
ncbi:hypothetical protein [Pedobacter metabolipauper]|uniref:Uncharacterized protein n=1 Tax=Pedobacter metabolipauper TaxID=425513 RepID=A0A4R6SVI9_9SPHI|nr:hypothetical protein [Pedobacter metabolipauper]TDQ09800.1 hypothetical protein ATK78_1959 [Pedobacter metabolipauper]